MNLNLPDYYAKFLNTLLSKTQSQSVLVKQLCELLRLQNRAIYNRLNGDTQFTINEAIRICRHYSIDISELLEQETGIMYQSGTIGYKMTKPSDYLKLLLHSLEWTRTLANPVIHYTSHDFPLFLTCQFPRIMKLKLAIWSYYSWELKSFNSASVLDLDDAEFSMTDEICKQVVSLYNSIPSVEYLPSSLFDNTIYQIRFLKEVEGFFNKVQLNQLINDLDSMVAYLEELALKGIKNPAPVKLYQSDMLNQSLNFMLEWDDGCRVYSMMDAPNFIYTESPRMTSHMKDYFRKILNTSESLTQSNAKERRKYFNHLFQKVKSLKEMIV